MPSIHCVHLQPKVSTRGGDGRYRSTLARKSRGNSELQVNEDPVWKNKVESTQEETWPQCRLLAFTCLHSDNHNHTHNIHTYKYTHMYIHKIFEAIQYNLYMSTPISKTSWLDRNLATKVKEKEMNRRERRPRQFNFLYLNRWRATILKIDESSKTSPWQHAGCVRW